MVSEQNGTKNLFLKLKINPMCKRTSAMVASFFLQKLFLPLFKAGVKQQTLHMNIKKTLIKLLIKYTSIKFKKKYSKNVTQVRFPRSLLFDT